MYNIKKWNQAQREEGRMAEQRLREGLARWNYGGAASVVVQKLPATKEQKAVQKIGKVMPKILFSSDEKLVTKLVTFGFLA